MEAKVSTLHWWLHYTITPPSLVPSLLIEPSHIPLPETPPLSLSPAASFPKSEASSAVLPGEPLGPPPLVRTASHAEASPKSSSESLPRPQISERRPSSDWALDKRAHSPFRMPMRHRAASTTYTNVPEYTPRFDELVQGRLTHHPFDSGPLSPRVPLRHSHGNVGRPEQQQAEASSSSSSQPPRQHQQRRSSPSGSPGPSCRLTPDEIPSSARLAALAALGTAQDTLGASWKRCCQWQLDGAPDIEALWNAITGITNLLPIARVTPDPAALSAIDPLLEPHSTTTSLQPSPPTSSSSSSSEDGNPRTATQLLHEASTRLNTFTTLLDAFNRERSNPSPLLSMQPSRAKRHAACERFVKDELVPWLRRAALDLTAALGLDERPRWEEPLMKGVAAAGDDGLDDHVPKLLLPGDDRDVVNAADIITVIGPPAMTETGAAAVGDDGLDPLPGGDIDVVDAGDIITVIGPPAVTETGAAAVGDDGVDDHVHEAAAASDTDQRDEPRTARARRWGRWVRDQVHRLCRRKNHFEHPRASGLVAKPGSKAKAAAKLFTRTPRRNA